MAVADEDRAPLSLPREAVRKALHLATCAVPVLYSRHLTRDILVAILAGGLLAAVGVEIARRQCRRVAAAFQWSFGALLRDGERAGVTGATWLVTACLAAVVLLPRPAAIAALWCACAGDPAATLVGRAFRGRPGARRAGAKTPAGSAACLLVSVAGTWGLARYPWGVAAIVAMAATIGERVQMRLDDNVRVVAAAGATAWLLS